MLLVFAAFSGIWLVGWAMGAPKRQRFGAMVALWALVGLLLAVLPVGPMRAALGGDLRPWLVLGAAGAVILAYRQGIFWLKRHVVQEVAPDRPAFSGTELGRYSRHILLREIGGPGQQRLKAARVLVVGAGGLGSPICLYLAAAGVGEIRVVDADRVESSNLQRQIIHRDDQIGAPKVQSAAQQMRAINPFISVKTYESRLDVGTAADLIRGCDLVLDGSDNFETRDLVNRVCTAQGVALISGALTAWEGQVSLFDPKNGTPCYHCVFPEKPLPGMVPACAEAGVVAPLPGVIGSLMAVEAIKHLTQAGQGLGGRLLIHDALYAETRVIMVNRRLDCPVCGVEHSLNI